MEINYRYIAYLLSMTCFCFFVYNWYMKIHYINYYPIHSSRISKNPAIVTKVHAKTENQRHGCGVILFAHIHKCAGGTVRAWFKKHAPLLDMITNITLHFSRKNVLKNARDHCKIGHMKYFRSTRGLQG